MCPAGIERLRDDPLAERKRDTFEKRRVARNEEWSIADSNR
jgi:hypothetical protein